MKANAFNIPLLYTFSRLYFEVKERRNRMGKTLILLASLAGKKSIDVMLADDDVESREIFIEAIKEVAPQVNVRVADNGRDLMGFLLNRPATLPDLIFLDLNMPLKNGHECLEEIRSNDELKDSPVIIYSTSSSLQHIDETYKRGADFYVPKPDSFKELKWIANKILSLDWAEHIRPRREKFVLVADRLK